LAATKGTTGAKRLAATFVSKFGPKFPSMNDASLDAMFDLLEDEDSQVIVRSYCDLLFVYWNHSIV